MIAEQLWLIDSDGKNVTVGFDNFEQAKEYAAKCGGEIGLYYTNKDTNQWCYKGIANSPIDVLAINKGVENGLVFETADEAISFLTDAMASCSEKDKQPIIQQLDTVKNYWSEGTHIFIDPYGNVTIAPQFSTEYEYEYETWIIGVAINLPEEGCNCEELINATINEIMPK